MKKINLWDKAKKYINYLIFPICFFIPKKKNRWVFGAWFGNRISDNSYALYKYIKRNVSDIECVWICNDVKKAEQIGIRAYRKNSLMAIWKCLTAKVAVMNQGYIDLGNFAWVRCGYKVQLWHGVPWKKIGEDAIPPKEGYLHKIGLVTYSFFNKYDFFIAPSEETQKVIKSAFATENEKIFLIGQPRNENLLSEAHCLNVRKKFQKDYGYSRKIIVYLPTFRDKSKIAFSFFSITELIMPILRKYDAIIVEKQHYMLQNNEEKIKSNERIFSNVDTDTQDLLAVADVLITDYSSCFFDFLLRDKPIIRFLYDFEDYKSKDRGLYYDLKYVTAGLNAMDIPELLDQINLVLAGKDNNEKQRQIVRNRFVTFEGTDNSKRIYEEIIRRSGC